MLLLPGLAATFDMYLFCFSEFSTVLALGDRAPLLLDFKQGAVGVFAGGGSVTFDACFADIWVRLAHARIELRRDSPCVLLIVDEDL